MERCLLHITLSLLPASYHVCVQMVVVTASKFVGECGRNALPTRIAVPAWHIPIASLKVLDL